MADPRWSKKLGQAATFAKTRQPADVVPGQVEHNRREVDVPQVAAVAIKTPSVASAAVPDVSTLNPGNAQLGPDRLHKYSGGQYGAYVFLGPDHGTGQADQLPPTNPGYRTVGVSASSLNDAYTKALALAAVLKANARVCIKILGGVWVESLSMTSASVDIEGTGTVLGHIDVAPSATQVSISGIEIASPDNNAALHVLLGPVFTFPYSSIRFYNLKIHGPQRVFWSERRVYLEGCEIFCDLAVDPILEDAPAIFQAAIDDNNWSVARNCKFMAYTTLHARAPIPVPGACSPSGYAIKATMKLGGYLPTMSGLMALTPAYQVKPNSGLALFNCEVQGELLCEGWAVKHDHCVVIGVPQGETGGTYATLRGLALVDPINGRYGQICTRVFFDHTQVHGYGIARFVKDPTQTTGADHFGGRVYFRHSEHLCQFDLGTGPATSPWSGDSIGEAAVVQSVTAHGTWSTGLGVITLIGNCPTATSDALALSAMNDPYLL